MGLFRFVGRKHPRTRSECISRNCRWERPLQREPTGTRHGSVAKQCYLLTGRPVSPTSWTLSVDADVGGGSSARLTAGPNPRWAHDLRDTRSQHAFSDCPFSGRSRNSLDLIFNVYVGNQCRSQEANNYSKSKLVRYMRYVHPPFRNLLI